MVVCTPHPGWGAVSLQRAGGLVRTIDLATCRSTTRASRFVVPTLTVRATRTSQSIVDHGKVVYTVHEDHSRIPAGAPGPIELFGASPDGRWVLFAIDPQGSQSLAADGLALLALSVRTGRVVHVADGLAYDDYRTWCGGKLVLTAGGDRIAGHHKWLIATQPPDWHARRLLTAPRFAFGSVACAADGVVVQATRDSATTMNPRWELWRVGLDGGFSVVDRPPPGWSDDAPHVARNDARRIVFVRSRNGRGTLIALGVGPLLGVGRDDGFYGHRPWAAVTWSP